MKNFLIGGLLTLLIIGTVSVRFKIDNQQAEIQGLKIELQKKEDKKEELEDYIEYLYCSMEYGNATAQVQYDLNTIFIATEVMIIKINGEPIKLPPMKEIDCR